MSSANRGRARNKDDLYETPYWMIEAEIPRLEWILKGCGDHQPSIWEPCAGNGRITRVLRHFFPNAHIHSSDIGEFEGLDQVVNFLACEPGRQPHRWDLIISNPPFFLAQEIIEHAQKLIGIDGSVVMLERLNFFGTKKREPWLTWDVPHSDISPRRASFLPTGQCDSIEYSWLEFQSRYKSDNSPKSFGENRLLPTMLCWGCHEVHYDKACGGCDYGYCKDCFIDHTHEACQKNLFGKTSMWYCFNHPDRPMTNACKAKGCSLPFCEDCWAEHVPVKGHPVCLELPNANK